MASEEGREPVVVVVEPARGVKSYPLNSKRLTAPILHRIASALGLPKAPLADARQMVEGKLSEDREPRNVQVDLVVSGSGTVVRLRDAGGVFLEEPLDDADGGEEPGTTLEDGERGAGDPEVGHAGEMEAEARESDAAAETMNGTRLRIELETAAERNTALTEEVKVLSEKVRAERDKNQECVRELERELERATQHNADLEEEVGVLKKESRRGGSKKS